MIFAANAKINLTLAVGPRRADGYHLVDTVMHTVSLCDCVDIVKTGGGTDPNAPVCVCIDGSTYYKTRVVSFPDIVKKELDEMLAKRNISYALTVCPDHAPMVGAAVAALLK